MSLVPPPQQAWSLDGTAAATHGGIRASLHGSCNWTQGHIDGTRALQLQGDCFASVAHGPSLLVGTGSLTLCARMRSRAPGSVLASKLAHFESPGAARITVGYGIEVGDERGLGINLVWALPSVHH